MTAVTTPDALGHVSRRSTRPGAAGGVIAALLAANLALVALSLGVGSYGLGPWDVWSALTGSGDAMAATVLHQFRLPRTLVSALCGGLLALSGALLQGLTRNGLADPSLLGVSQGAALAVVALIVAWPDAPQAWRTPTAFMGGVAAALLVQAVAHGPRGTGPLRLILSGVALSAFLAALTATLLTHGALPDAQAALAWLSGSLASVGWAEVQALALVALIAAPVAAGLARPLAVLRFGPDIATGLGLRVGPARLAALALAVLAAAAATAAVGPLGFVGLVGPHIARRLGRAGSPTGPRAGVETHLVLSALVGALVVGAADLAGRSLVAPVQLPAGLVTSLLGGPVFVWLLLRRDPARTA